MLQHARDTQKRAEGAMTCTVCCSVVQGVEVCCTPVFCSVLQHTPGTGSEHGRDDDICSVLQCVAVCCSVSQCVAVYRNLACCSASQCVAACAQRIERWWTWSWHVLWVAVSCSVLQCVAVYRNPACCSALRRVAVRCSALQRVAARCRVLPRAHKTQTECKRDEDTRKVLQCVTVCALHPSRNYCNAHIVSPKSTKSRNSISSVSCGTNPNSDFGSIWNCTEEFECLDLVDFGGVAFSVETVVYCNLAFEQLHCILREIAILIWEIAIYLSSLTVTSHI